MPKDVQTFLRSSHLEHDTFGNFLQEAPWIGLTRAAVSAPRENQNTRSLAMSHAVRYATTTRQKGFQFVNIPMLQTIEVRVHFFLRVHMMVDPSPVYLKVRFQVLQFMVCIILAGCKWRYDAFAAYGIMWRCIFTSHRMHHDYLNTFKKHTKYS